MSDKLAEAQAALVRAVAERSRARAELDQARAARAQARKGDDPLTYDVARKKQSVAFQAYSAAYDAVLIARQRVRRVDAVAICRIGRIEGKERAARRRAA